MTTAALTPSERAALQAAIDSPMTDEEACELLIELAQLVAELAKLDAPAQQLEMAKLAIRTANMMRHVTERLLPVQGGAA